MKVVLDTNILVSALISPFGPPARVLDLVLTGDLQLAYDDRIMTEYRDVLNRERFSFDQSDARDLLEYLQAEGELVVASPLHKPLPDPDDEPFLEVAIASRADALITGNVRHYPAQARQGISVLPPADFITRWQKGVQGSG